MHGVVVVLGYFAPRNICCSVIARPEKKTVIFEPLKTDGRADGNQKTRYPLSILPVSPLQDNLRNNRAPEGREKENFEEFEFFLRPKLPKKNSFKAVSGEN